VLRSGNRHAAGLVAGLEHRGVALDRLQAPRADRITGQQHLKLVGREVPIARRDGHAALAGAQFGADDAERQRRRFGLAAGLLGARLGGCCGTRGGLARLDLLDLARSA
jgi:hypothetical protein